MGARLPTRLCRDDQAVPFYGLVFGLRVWRCARTHVQLRATRAADVACEDDSLGLGLSLKESTFVDDMVRPRLRWFMRHPRVCLLTLTPCGLYCR